MPGADLTIAELETLINRARSAVPSVGSEQSLSSDVSLLAALYGRMIFRGVSTVPLAHLSERQRLALGRWREAGDPA
jgi:hypothetical protein